MTVTLRTFNIIDYINNCEFKTLPSVDSKVVCHEQSDFLNHILNEKLYSPRGLCTLFVMVMCVHCMFKQTSPHFLSKLH